MVSIVFVVFWMAMIGKACLRSSLGVPLLMGAHGSLSCINVSPIFVSSNFSFYELEPEELGWCNPLQNHRSPAGHFLL
jgi:hypothetical protein